MRLIEEKNHPNNYNKIFCFELVNNVKAKHPELLFCFWLCDLNDISITDIIIEEVNKNTGYNVAWQHCIRYDLEDFKSTFNNIENFIKQHDTSNFTGWCVIFEFNDREYSISSQNNNRIVLHSTKEIDCRLENVIQCLSI